MMHRWLLVTGIALFVFGAAFASGENRKSEPDQGDQQSALMLAKLASTQKITNGLVTKDFEQILRGANELDRICSATAWASHSDRIYAHHRTELRRQSQKLAKMAKEENLDGAAFTYMQSLTTCISCHEYCRDVLKIADESEIKLKVVPIPVNVQEADAAKKKTNRR